MLQTIRLFLMDDDGNKLELPEKGANNHIQSKLDVAIAEKFTEINRRINDLGDDGLRCAEKFELALDLERFLDSFKETYQLEELTK